MAAKKQHTKLTAQIVSRLLGPPVWMALGGLGIYYRYRFNAWTAIWVILPFVVSVSIYVLYAVLISKKTDYEFTDVKSRRPAMLIGCLSLFVSLLISINMQPVLTPVIMRLLIVLIAVTAITFYWKISFHTTGFTIGVMMLVQYVDFRLFVLIYLSPLLYWARIALKKHTFEQLILGSFVSVLMII